VSGLLKIEEPFHGAVINWRQGKKTEDCLLINVQGYAPIRDSVVVNGVQAKRSLENFTAQVLLKAEETEIVAISRGSSGHKEHRIRVVLDKLSKPRYQFFIDDNIFFMRDIFKHNYKSLFDCFYLAGLKKLHEKYKTKFTLNLFYDDGENFSLKQFPDRYKSEWLENSGWLKLAFHAYSEFPDRPYQYDNGEKLAKDFDLMKEEIIRFAGKETYSVPSVIHWGMVQPSALPVLAQRGIKVLGGCFIPVESGYDINYLLDDERCAYIWNNEALKDFATGIIFSRVDLICNNTPVDKINSVLESLRNNPAQAEVMNLATHEQYFWPFYFNYIPDHFQRLDTALKWVTENGYECVFLQEGYLFNSRLENPFL